MIPIAKIGPIQLKDVEHSGKELHDDYFRTCTVLQGEPPTSDIGDDVPHRISELYGKEPEHWNRHFIVQVAGCPLKCWYCYVDNLKANEEVSIESLVKSYRDFKEKIPELNVFHFMGGCPLRYASTLPRIREELDRVGLYESVILTDSILLEDFLYASHPWDYIPERTIVSACLKGTNPKNFYKNTGTLYFFQAVRELWKYIPNQKVYFSLLEEDKGDKLALTTFLPKSRVNQLEVKYYQVVKDRLGPED